MVRAISTARAAVSGAISAGAVVRWRMWLLCSFSQTSKAAKAPSSPRAQITEISLVNGTTPSRIAGTPPSERNATARSVPSLIVVWPLPS